MRHGQEMVYIKYRHFKCFLIGGWWWHMCVETWINMTQQSSWCFFFFWILFGSFPFIPLLVGSMMFHQPLNVGCSFVHDPNPRLVTARLSASRPSWPSKVSWEQRTLGTYPPGHARKLGLWCSDGPVRLWNSWVCVEYGESHMNGWIPKMTKLVISLCIDYSHKYINIYIYII